MSFYKSYIYTYLLKKKHLNVWDALIKKIITTTNDVILIVLKRLKIKPKILLEEIQSYTASIVM